MLNVDSLSSLSLVLYLSLQRYTTVTAIAILLLANIVPWALSFIRRKGVTQHDSDYLVWASHYCEKGQLIFIFLVYPALTKIIMRTFVCKAYAQDDEGNPTWWLVDDTVVQCRTDFLSIAATKTGGVAATGITATSMVMESAANMTSNATVGVVATSTDPYVFLYVYSWCMIAVVVLGFPAILVYRLW